MNHKLHDHIEDTKQYQRLIDNINIAIDPIQQLK